MARESSLDDSPDPNYASKRHTERGLALEALRVAKYRLDNVMRGSADRRTRTLVSTAYNLVKETVDLVELIEDIDDEWE